MNSAAKCSELAKNILEIKIDRSDRKISKMQGLRKLNHGIKRGLLYYQHGNTLTANGHITLHVHLFIG